MSFAQIPTALLNNPDRNAAFQGIKAWMQDEMSAPQVSVEDAISAGAKTIDIALGGGYIPGRMTEIVEPQPSRGAQSLIHHTIIQARKNLQYVALIDAANQFDPQSENMINLQSLLWVRTPKTTDAIKACDILIRDGNFPLLILDLRTQLSHRKNLIRPNEWYRIQRTCEQSRIAFVAFTHQSTIPCAHFRLQLSQSLPIDILDHPRADAFSYIDCEILKRRRFQYTVENSNVQNQSELKVANAHF